MKKLNIVKTLFTLLILAGLVSIVFIPLPWSFTLPCEVVPKSSTIVTVREAGFSAAELPEEARNVRKGDLILPMTNVFLDFSIKRYEAMIRTNHAELDLSRMDQRSMGLTPVLFEKLRINTLTRTEMIRRRSDMKVIASCDGLFIPQVKEISPGRYLDKGLILGKIVSAENTLYAYAPDNEVNHIRIGSKVTYYLRGEIQKRYGKVTAVNPVAVTFRDSTLVRQLGGTIDCYPKPKTQEFVPVNVLYRVEIASESTLPRHTGRIGIAHVAHSYKLYEELYRRILHVFFREFTF